METINKWWPPADKAKLTAILKAVNRNPALGPAGRCQQLPTNDDVSYYAFLQATLARDRAALVVLNYQPTQAEVTVRLDVAGIIPGSIRLSSELVSSLGDQQAPVGNDNLLRIRLPACGYAFYDAELQGVAASRNTAPFKERDGLVVIEAEHYHATAHTNSWREVAGLSGKAMKVMLGPWSRYLRYDIDFSRAGTYRLWVMGRKNPAAPQYAGNDLKVFLYPASEPNPKIGPGYTLFEIGFGEQKEFRWRDTVKSKTVRTTDLKIETPGVYRLYIVGGAGEEHGWELDRLLLSRDNQQPPSGAIVGPPETL